MPAEILKFDSFTDRRGSLTVGEYPKNLPFAPVRFFVVSDVPHDLPRGNHAHKTNHQLLFCLSGSLAVDVFDGKIWSTFKLSPNGEGLYLPPLNWGVQKEFEPGTNLLVLASEAYSANEYIYTLDDLIKLTNKAKHGSA
jgi:UDP-2-acetamido-3-amino-2,3-dideoxy-glucuronate N-acetyltransferase